MKKIVFKLILAIALLIVVVSIIINLNSRYTGENVSKNELENSITPTHQADDLIDRSMLIQISEKYVNDNSYHINLSEDGILFKYLDSNKNTKNIYDRYTIISEKQLTYEQKKDLEQKIDKLNRKDDIDNEKVYVILYAGEEKNVDITQLNNILIEYGITF